MLSLLCVALLAPPVTCADCDGPALLKHFECNRCHDGLPGPAAPPEKQCLGCHREILADRFEAPPAALAKWKANLKSLNHVPSLTGIGARFQAGWLAAFLQAPHDLRPTLPASMPRLTITPQQATTLARYLAPPNVSNAPPKGDARRGRALYGQLGCGICHRFNTPEAPPVGALAIPLKGDALTRGIMLAPELSVTRARFKPSALARWLRDPKSLKPDTLMPDFKLSAVDARDLAAWIRTAPLATATPSAPVKAPPALDRPVKWPEVRDRVFRKICWHCHSDAELAHGDGGPGNTGGFGFAPRGLNLATYGGISSGIRDAQTGTRRSVFRPGPDGTTPLIVAAMLARHVEVNGGVVPGVRGMPLGLPPIPIDDIQRVITWIANGRPR